MNLFVSKNRWKTSFLLAYLYCARQYLERADGSSYPLQGHKEYSEMHYLLLIDAAVDWSSMYPEVIESIKCHHENIISTLVNTNFSASGLPLQNISF